MPRRSDMDLLSQIIECGHSDIADAYACDVCTPRPIRDPYAAIRVRAAQGQARPSWGRIGPSSPSGTLLGGDRVIRWPG
jgi:hypothetical protein